MVIEIIVKEDKKKYLEKHLYEFAHIAIRCGILGWLDNHVVLYDEKDVEPEVLHSFPVHVLSNVNNGELVKFVEGYKTFEKYEEPCVITYDGDLYVMENGKTVGKF